MLPSLFRLLSTALVFLTWSIEASSDPSPSSQPYPCEDSESLQDWQVEMLHTIEVAFRHASVSPMLIFGKEMYVLELSLLSRTLLEKLWPYENGVPSSKALARIRDGLWNRGYYLSEENINKFFANRHNNELSRGRLPQPYEDEILRLRAQGELTDELVAVGLVEVFQRLPKLPDLHKPLSAFVDHIRRLTASDRAPLLGEIEASAELMDRFLTLDSLGTFVFSDKMHNHLTYAVYRC